MGTAWVIRCFEVCFLGEEALNPNNQQVKLAEMTPSDTIKQKCGELRKDRYKQASQVGRVAIGAFLIKERHGFPDEDVVEEIWMNPCPQYYIGLGEYA